MLSYLNYNRSLLSLVSSVQKHYGIPTKHNTLTEMDTFLQKGYKNVVVMLFDGMGTAILEKHLPEDAFLRRNLYTSISSVFPPTTTAATVTMDSGLSPIEHGWLGWSLFFDEIGANVSIFPNVLSGGGEQKAAEYNVAQRYLPFKSVFEKITEHSGAQAYWVSPFSSYESKSVSEICNTVVSLCNEGGRKYIYTYWHQPDYDMHDLGTKHAYITDCIKQINKEVELLCSKVHDTLVVVTADHGLVDTDWLFLNDYPDIYDCLLRMPSIESRAMSFFIKSDKKVLFEKLFKEYFGEYYILISKEEVLKQKLFGHGIPHSRSVGFIGDFIAVANSNISIECGSIQSNTFKAAHAGMTKDELIVPFIVNECL